MSEEALSDFEDDGPEATPMVLQNDAPPDHGTGGGDVDRSLLLSKELDEVRSSNEELKKKLKKELDEVRRQKEEAVSSSEEVKRKLRKDLDEVRSSNEELRRQLSESVESREQALKQMEALSRHKEEVSKAREQLKSEVEASARLLVSGAEKLASLIGDSKMFTGGLPRSSKYTGLAAVCHGFCKRAEEIVEELCKQRDAAVKNRQETREQMDQRNYQIAIEVSQLEAAIMQSKEQLERSKADWKTEIEEKAKVQNSLREHLSQLAKEAESSRKACEVLEERVKVHQAETGRMKNLLVEHFKGYLATEEAFLNFLHKLDGRGVKAVSALPFSDFSDIDSLHQEYVKRVSSISDLLVHVENSWAEKEEFRQKEKQQLEKTVQQQLEKERSVATFLRKILENMAAELTDDQANDVVRLSCAVDACVRTSKLKHLELERHVAEARSENEKLTNLIKLQTQDLAAKAERIRELEEANGVSSESVHGLAAEVAAAEVELARWKEAAKEEAAAGVAVLEEVEKCNKEIASLNQLVLQLRRSLEEANKKLQSKEEIVSAAIAARDAAARSLRIADERAAELRERLDETSRQLEEAEAQIESSRVCGATLLELVPWLRSKLSSTNSGADAATAPASEMEELAEPLI